MYQVCVYPPGCNVIVFQSLDFDTATNTAFRFELLGWKVVIQPAEVA